MRDMLLFGAGASMGAGVPNAVGLTAAIHDALRARNDYRESIPHQALSFVIGALTFHRGVLGLDVTRPPDVEAVFDAVQVLAARGTSPISALVGSWHARAIELDQLVPVRDHGSPLGHSLHDLERFIKDTIGSVLNRESFVQSWARDSFATNLMEAISEMLHGSTGAAFSMAADRMRRELVKLVWVSSAERVEYLRPVLSLAERQQTLTVATLNYDNTLELLAKTHDVEYRTGIGSWATESPFDDASLHSTLAILKLHGSIDWRSRSDPHTQEFAQPADIETVDSPLDSPMYYDPLVLFGGGNKLRVEGPFLDLLHAFRRELRKSDRLSVVGYSFRDDHVNHYLRMWLAADETRELRVIDPNFESSDVPFAHEIRRLGSRLTHLKCDAEDGLRQLTA